MAAAADPQLAATATVPPAPAAPRHMLRMALFFSLPILLLAAAAVWWALSGRSVATDNAYVRQDKVSISAEVGGRIIDVAVHENQAVKAGDLLFRIDPEPYRLALAQAEADIAAAEARVTTLAVTADTMDADIETERQAVRYAEANLARERELMARGFNTRVRVDAAELRVNEARGKLSDARMAVIRARAQLATGRSIPGVNPGLLAARAKRDQALLNLARTEVRAPISGLVSQSSRLQRGQTMVQGLPAVTIVAAQTGWVEANFKETDLDRMRVGQRAKVTIDAIDGGSFAGRVQSIGAGTGSEFSVLPAQNATGNWVKVTQRIPVRITFDHPPPRPLIAGLSAEVRVFIDDDRR